MTADGLSAAVGINTRACLIRVSPQRNSSNFARMEFSNLHCPSQCLKWCESLGVGSFALLEHAAQSCSIGSLKVGYIRQEICE